METLPHKAGSGTHPANINPRSTYRLVKWEGRKEEELVRWWMISFTQTTF
jgi:hypothetical protein